MVNQSERQGVLSLYVHAYRVYPIGNRITGWDQRSDTQNVSATFCPRRDEETYYPRVRCPRCQRNSSRTHNDGPPVGNSQRRQQLERVTGKACEGEYEAYGAAWVGFNHTRRTRDDAELTTRWFLSSRGAGPRRADARANDDERPAGHYKSS